MAVSKTADGGSNPSRVARTNAIVAESADALAREAGGNHHESSSLSNRTKNFMRTWRNWFTHLAQTQGRFGNVGSNPTVRTKLMRPWWNR